MLRLTIHSVVLLILYSQVATAQVTTPVPPQPVEVQQQPYVAPNPALPNPAIQTPGLQHHGTVNSAVADTRRVPGFQQDLRCRMQWGLTAMPLPDFLRASQLNLLPNQGLLVTSVYPYSAAQRAGIQPGQLILDVDGNVVTAQTGLPPLESACTVTVLSDQGTLGLTIQPHHAYYQGANSPAWLSQGIQSLLDQQFALASVGMPGSLGAVTRTPSCIRSLSVNRLGDEIICSAIVRGDNGLERLQLHGSPQDIECQLGKLAPEIQQALRPQLGF